MSVQKFLDKIKNGRYGADITDAIIGGIKKCYDDASVNHDNANMEVKMARGTHNTLNDRLDNVDEIQAQTNAQLSTKAKEADLIVERERINQLTRLDDGSTTGDAELIDARIMSNSEVASNVGEAIRNQTSFLEKMTNLKNEENGLISTMLDVQWQIGKYDVNTGSAIENNSMVRSFRFDVNGVIELNIKNPNDYTLYHYFLFDENDKFLSSGELTSKFIIKHTGKIAFDTAKVNYPAMSDKIDETKNNFIIIQHNSELENVKNDVAKVENKVNELKNTFYSNVTLDITNGKYVVGKSDKDNNATYFSTQKIKLNSGSRIEYTDSKYMQIELVEFDENMICDKVTVSNSKNINKDGVYAIQGYVSLKQLTQDDINMILNDMKVLSFFIETGSGLPSDSDSYQKTIVYSPKVIENSVSTTPTTLDYYKYPLTPVWGHEYLEHWYERIYDGTNNVTIALDGDSITQGYEPLTSVQDAFFGMRDHALKRIMKAGNYDLNKLTIRNNGFGGRNTNEWVGNPTYAMPTWLNQYPNGFLHQSMSYNPDLLIIGYGMNDADKNHSMFNDLTLEQRLKLFKTNMEEGLQRIRGNAPVNGRPAYNKSTKELSIIITLPTMGTIANTGRTNLEWFQNVRPIIQELCRKYECAFADFTMRTYAHNDMKVPVWATLNADGNYGTIHPNKYSMAQIMSQLQDLIYPVCMWNIDID